MSSSGGVQKLGHHFTHKRDLPIGTVNAQGRMKIEDPETGNIKWVSAKTGLIRDYAGGITAKKLEPKAKKPPMHTAHFSGKR